MRSIPIIEEDCVDEDCVYFCSISSVNLLREIGPYRAMPHTIGSSCFKTRRNYENDEMNDVKDEKDKIDLEN